MICFGGDLGEEEERKETEHFNPIEPRGEEREATTPTPQVGEQHERGAVEFRKQSPRVEVNGTGREIDDYSSDDNDDDKKNKVISMENVEAETKPIRHRRSSSSSSASSAESDSDDKDRQQERGDQSNTIVNVDLLDREEREQEQARKERERRDEIRRREEEKYMQQHQEERDRKKEEQKRAEEERRQQEVYNQQKREEERRLEAEKEKQRREEEEENRRQAAMIQEDPQVKEEERIKSQKLREAQILEEQIAREAKRKEEEKARENKWQEEEARREEQRKSDTEERTRRRELEESLSSARTGSSTARSSSSVSSSEGSPSATSSATSTPRRNQPEKLSAQQEETERARASSPLPPAAVYEKRRRNLSATQEDEPPPRSVSPFPEAAVYIDRPKRQREEKTEPVPVTAVYQERPKSVVRRPVPVIGINDQTRISEDQDTTLSSARSTSSRDTLSYSTEEEEEELAPKTRQNKRAEVVSSSDEEKTTSSSSQRDTEAGRRTQDEDSGTADSSSDSGDSDDDGGDSSGTNTGRSGTKASEVTVAAEVEHQRPETEMSGGEVNTLSRATSESDGENMHGGADPDNVAEQETVGELHPLRTRDRPAAKSHDGKVSELLTSPESVELSNVLLNKTQVYEVAAHLETADTVKMISMCNTGLDDDDLQRLTEAITASPSDPVMLNLSLNSLTQNSVKHVLHVLKAKPSIKLLILQSNPVGDTGVQELVQGLQTLHREAKVQRRAAAAENTDTMSVDSNASSVDPAIAAQRYLLQELDLADTSLSDQGATHVAQLIASNVYVEALSLSHNTGITAEEGWSQIGEALARNRCLKTLTLDGNKIADKGIQHLARGLHNNRSLRSLTLEDAGIGEEGGKYIMAMLKRNTTMLELTLSPGNSISEDMMENIKKYIALNRAPYNNFGL